MKKGEIQLHAVLPFQYNEGKFNVAIEKGIGVGHRIHLTSPFKWKNERKCATGIFNNLLSVA